MAFNYTYIISKSLAIGRNYYQVYYDFKEMAFMMENSFFNLRKQERRFD